MSGRRNRINDEDEVESRQNDHELHFKDIKRQIFSVIVSNVCSTRRVLTVSHMFPQKVSSSFTWSSVASGESQRGRRTRGNTTRRTL